ncbi:ABC transporter substrate-binding protein [Evansella cellulosilytica]|uniref:Extracellular solute-binding protein family 1 n=1 Tax=Evansella cellulosilytica (strain ATCC 21833 / DSM 2522 / FERM P-1141 / JCM 9156 / N-4) TaxID=649639 RepID=E6TZ94_EVAC2|nr:ABC transporter substrate-binding protein [Evansella cellulosilytica]ADU28956.1 extracellular solute-binding protein family 1 [Evansella cellulosilytica DSM 2522]
MKKYWKLGATTFLAASLLAACGGDGDTENGGDTTDNGDAGEETTEEQIGSDDAEVELVFWEFGNTGYDVLIQEYVEANPHVSINLQNQDMNDLHDNLFTSISAGSGAPDIAMIEEAAIERFKAAEDRFNNLYDLGASDVEGDFLEWVWRSGQSADGSIQFGLPTDIGPTVMFYRTDVFEEAGFDSSPEAVSELLATWEDFANVAQEINDATGALMTDSGELVYNARRDQASQTYFNAEGEYILEDNEQIREAYDYVADLFDAGLVGDIPLWTPEWFAGMDDASYAVFLAPAWMQGVIKDNSPEEGVWSITTMPEGAGNWGGSYLTLPNEGDHAEEAYAFIEWLTAPEQQFKAFQGYGLFPSTPAVYDMPEFQEYEDSYFGGINTAQVFSEAAEAVLPVYKGRNYYPVDDEIKEALDNIAGGSDPDSEWQSMLDRVQSVLDRQ